MISDSDLNKERLKRCYFGCLGSKPIQTSVELKPGNYPNDYKHPTEYNAEMVGYLLPNMCLGDQRNPPTVGTTRVDLWVAFIERNNLDSPMDFSLVFFFLSSCHFSSFHCFFCVLFFI